jgi:hypothetical protein
MIYFTNTRIPPKKRSGKKRLSLTLVLLLSVAYAQSIIPKIAEFTFTITVFNEGSRPLNAASVELLKNGKLLKVEITDSSGMAIFHQLTAGDYAFMITYTGYQSQTAGSYHFPGDAGVAQVVLQPESGSLKEVRITALKPFIEQTQGKVIVHVDASPSNVGTTVLEVLEKSPGVTVNRSGGIALQGKPGVLVTIDDKPTYLSGGDLNNLLSSMGSSQVDQIELIANPSAKYDASGNAGIINIKTKKSKQQGFNGTMTATEGQGVYPKNSENLSLNYKKGRFNSFLTYDLNFVQYYLDLYALRKYYDGNGLLLSCSPPILQGHF